jgi:hypothetical protein
MVAGYGIRVETTMRAVCDKALVFFYLPPLPPQLEFLQLPINYSPIQKVYSGVFYPTFMILE